MMPLQLSPVLGGNGLAATRYVNPKITAAEIFIVAVLKEVL